PRLEHAGGDPSVESGRGEQSGAADLAGRSLFDLPVGKGDMSVSVLVKTRSNAIIEAEGFKLVGIITHRHAKPPSKKWSHLIAVLAASKNPPETRMAHACFLRGPGPRAKVTLFARIASGKLDLPAPAA